MKLPNGWNLTPLGSVLERVSLPVDVDPTKEYREIGIRSHGKGIFHKPSVTGESLGEKRVFWVVPDTLVLNIVFAWEQAVAITSENENGMIASHRFPMYRSIDSRCDIRFLWQFFKTKRGKELLEIASPGGAGRNKTLGQKEFERLRIPLPSNVEQVRIVQVLAISAAMLEVTNRLLIATKKQRNGLATLLLSGKLRLPGFGKPWIRKSVRNMGKVVSGGTPNTSSPEYWDGDILWATPSDISSIRGRYIHKTAHQITEQGLRNSATNLLPSGALLVCTRATICELAIAATSISTNQGFKNLIPSPKYDAEFLFHLFRSNKHRFKRMACGSTFLELSKHDFERMEFLVPEYDEQIAISKRINALEDQIAAIHSCIDNFRIQKGALMQQLLLAKRRLLQEPISVSLFSQ